MCWGQRELADVIFPKFQLVQMNTLILNTQIYILHKALCQQ
jgi:hypothetical protein